MEKFQLIAVETLDTWIKAEKKFNLLDVRPSSQRNQVNISGSLHTDQYALIKAEASETFRSFHLDKSVPVITFCNGGKVANIAAAILRNLGYEAYSLKGGLDQWKLYQESKNIFEEDSVGYDSWFDKHPILFENELKALRMLLPHEGKGLEIGVGTGRFAQALGIKEGLEPAKSMAKIAAQRGIQVKEGVAEALPYKGQSFDFLMMVTTLCFLKDIPKAFEEARRVLKKDGQLVIGLIDKNSPLGRLYEETKESNPWYKNAHFHSTEDTIQALSNAGFSGFEYCQILFSSVERPEAPIPGFGEGSFVVIKAKK
jgi:ubiquinone/menaquinone biosynthesis C-methylase UbiE/rhodanese-related sulfurtransferase